MQRLCWTLLPWRKPRIYHEKPGILVYIPCYTINNNNNIYFITAPFITLAVSYRFDNWRPHIHWHRCMCTCPSGQCRCRRVDKGGWHIRWYLKQCRKRKIRNHFACPTKIRVKLLRMCSVVCNVLLFALWYLSFVLSIVNIRNNFKTDEGRHSSLLNMIYWTHLSFGVTILIVSVIVVVVKG